MNYFISHAKIVKCICYAFRMLWFMVMVSLLGRLMKLVPI
jgi:hypothetical protein